MRPRIQESVKQEEGVRHSSLPLYSMKAFSSSRIKFVCLRNVCLIVQYLLATLLIYFIYKKIILLFFKKRRLFNYNKDQFFL